VNFLFGDHRPVMQIIITAVTRVQYIIGGFIPFIGYPVQHALGFGLYMAEEIDPKASYAHCQTRQTS
jgi:hypothetical protein